MTIEEIERTCYQGEQWPRDEREAAGPIPEELWEISLAYYPET